MDQTPLWFSITATTIQTLTTVVAVIAAIIGVSAWKKQLRNTEDHGLVRELLLAAYRLRDGLQFIRNPWMQVRSTDEKGVMLTNEARHLEVTKEYTSRVVEAASRRNNLEVKISEAEALWGEPVRSWFMPLIERHSELVVSVETHLDAIRPGEPTPTPDNAELFKKSRKIVYSHSHSSPDEFDQGVIAALDGIREKLKPRMVAR